MYEFGLVSVHSISSFLCARHCVKLYDTTVRETDGILPFMKLNVSLITTNKYVSTNWVKKK